jgi:hypothetical protein
VQVSQSASDGYTVVAKSNSGNSFTIKKVSGGAPTRTCSMVGGKTSGGCKTEGGSW